MIPRTIKRQAISATDTERDIIVARAMDAEKAEEAFVLAQNRSNEVFTVFCAAHGLPTGCVLVGAKDGHIILDLPEEDKTDKGETQKVVPKAD